MEKLAFTQSNVSYQNARCRKDCNESLTWMNFLHRGSGTGNLWLPGHAQVLVPLLIPVIASNCGAAMPR